MIRVALWIFLLFESGNDWPRAFRNEGRIKKDIEKKSEIVDTNTPTIFVLDSVYNLFFLAVIMQ